MGEDKLAKREVNRGTFQTAALRDETLIEFVLAAKSDQEEVRVTSSLFYSYKADSRGGVLGVGSHNENKWCSH